MLIEADARRYITDSIELEREMVLLEVREKARNKMAIDSTEYRELRVKMVQIINQINTVANPEGILYIN